MVDDDINVIPLPEKPRKMRRCPVCQKPAALRFRPFCSKRCADIDLGRWFNEAYRAPVTEDESDAMDSQEKGGSD